MDPAIDIRETPKRRSALKVLGIAAAIALPLITAVTVTITVLANMNERASSASSLEAQSERAGADPFVDAAVIGAVEQDGWQNMVLLPLDAPLAEFPVPAGVEESWGTDYPCGDGQYDWLAEHGERYNPDAPKNTFTVTLRNTATSSGALALGNIRFVGEEFEEQPRYSFVCNWGGRGAGTLSQMLVVGAEGEEAIYSEPVNASGAEEMPAGSPVTLNLAPGEVLVITLTRGDWVDPQKSYRGRFVADVQDGSGETVVIAEDIVFHRDPLSGFALYYGAMGTPDGVFYCAREGTSKNPGDPCTLDEAARYAREAAAAES